MNSLLAIPLVIAGTVYASYSLLHDPKINQIKQAIRNTKLVDKEHPLTILNKTIYKSHYELKIKIPYGIKQKIVDEEVRQIAFNLDADIQYEVNGVVVKLSIFFNKLPEYINYHENMHYDIPKMELPFFVGISRRGYTAIDLIKDPNILIGGKVRYGKTSLVKLALTTLFRLRTPEELVVYIVDTKQLDFSHRLWTTIPHIREIALEQLDAEKIVFKLREEMKQRGNVLKGFNNIEDYNAEAETKLPYIVLFIDEFSDFDYDEYKDFWDNLAEIGRKGGALGIKLWLANQRPDRDQLPQKVKANLGTQIAFSVQNTYNSEIILGNGNDQAFYLKHKGRCIVQNGGEQIEVQVPFISPKQMERLIYLLESEYYEQKPRNSRPFNKVSTIKS